MKGGNSKKLNTRNNFNLDITIYINLDHYLITALESPAVSRVGM